MELTRKPGAGPFADFIGDWHVEGWQLPSPFGPEARVDAHEKFVWMTGGAFIVHRLDGTLAERPLGCIEIIGHGASHAYYSDGSERTWRIEHTGNAWVFCSQANDVQIRCMIAFSDDRRVRHAKWEYGNEAGEWHPFWETLALRKS